MHSTQCNANRILFVPVALLFHVSSMDFLLFRLICVPWSQKKTEWWQFMFLSTILFHCSPLLMWKEQKRFEGFFMNFTFGLCGAHISLRWCEGKRSTSKQKHLFLCSFSVVKQQSWTVWRREMQKCNVKTKQWKTRKNRTHGQSVSNVAESPMNVIWQICISFSFVRNGRRDKLGQQQKVHSLWKGN